MSCVWRWAILASSSSQWMYVLEVAGEHSNRSTKNKNEFTLCAQKCVSACVYKHLIMREILCILNNIVYIFSVRSSAFHCNFALHSSQQNANKCQKMMTTKGGMVRELQVWLWLMLCAVWAGGLKSGSFAVWECICGRCGYGIRYRRQANPLCTHNSDVDGAGLRQKRLAESWESSQEIVLSMCWRFFCAQFFPCSGWDWGSKTVGGGNANCWRGRGGGGHAVCLMRKKHKMYKLFHEEVFIYTVSRDRVYARKVC